MTRQELARPLNVGARSAEIRAALDECERRCALLGWPDVRRQLLVEGADFRDLLAAPHLKAVDAR